MEAFDLFMTRDALHQRRWSIKRFDVDMLMLERMFVKTLINLNHVRGWQVGDDPTHPQTPTESWWKLRSVCEDLRTPKVYTYLRRREIA